MTQQPTPLVKHVLTIIVSLEPEAYLVGGLIRDHFLGRPCPVDMDVVVAGDGFELARRLTHVIETKATFVPLDKKSGTGRVILADVEHPCCLDISSLKGESILEDLCARDFTANAMAVSVSNFIASDYSQVIDPCNGMADLKSGVLKSCSRRSFTDDPLRILRAFRFRASLGFEISEDTLGLIPEGLQFLYKIAGERIRDEIFSILSEKRSSSIIEKMDRLGILDVLFPEILPSKGCLQNQYHHLDVWGHCVETLCQFERAMEDLSVFCGQWKHQFDGYLHEEPVRGRSRGALLKLAALFHDIGKPYTRSEDVAARIRFLGHEKISKALFREIGDRVKLSRREIDSAGNLIGGHMRLSVLTNDCVSPRALNRIFRDFQTDFMGLILLYFADMEASRGPWRSLSERGRIRTVGKRAVEEYFQRRERCTAPLLTGNDLKEQFGLEEGPFLGSILNKLKQLQEMGDVASRGDALSAVGVMLAQELKRDEAH